MSEKQKRLAVVTGAGGGIGLATCRRLAKDGFIVVPTDITLERATAIASELQANGFTASPYKLDVTQNARQVSEVFDEILAKFGRIDVLVNNAGGSAGLLGKLSDFCDAEESTWEFVVGLNLYGTMRCTHSVLGAMKSSGYGRIINLASVAGNCGLPGRADYSAAKAGIIGFSKALAMEVGCYGITVNCISPGMIERMRPVPGEALPRECHVSPSDGTWLGHTGTPDDIAATIAFLASEEAGYITGDDILVDGGRTLGATTQMSRQDFFKKELSK